MRKFILSAFCMALGVAVGSTSFNTAQAFPDGFQTETWSPRCPVGFNLVVNSEFHEKDGDFSANYTCERGPINCGAPVGASVSSSVVVDSPVTDASEQKDYWITLECSVFDVSKTP